MGNGRARRRVALTMRQPSGVEWSRGAERHRQLDASFLPPAGWIDRTVFAFRQPGFEELGTPPTMTVSHELLREVESFRRFVDRKLVWLAKNVTAFELLETTEATLGGRKTTCLRFRFATPAAEGERLEQVMVMTDPEGFPERSVTILAVAAPVELLPDAEVAFAQLLQSLSFGGPAEPERAGASPEPEEPEVTGSRAPLVPMPRYRDGDVPRR